jgi:hypothetical protein
VQCAELEQVKECLQKHSLVVAMMLIYYSNICIGKWSSDNMRKLDRERFRILIEDIRIIDPKARSCRNINELDGVFAVSSQEVMLLSVLYLQDFRSATARSDVKRQL